MIAIVLHLQKRLSWKLGQSDAAQGRPCNSPWWAKETYYVLAYYQAKLAEYSRPMPAIITKIDRRPTDFGTATRRST